MPNDQSCCVSCAFYNGYLEELKNALDSHGLSDSQAWSMGVELLRNVNRPDRLKQFLLERDLKSETPLYWNGILLRHAVGPDNIEIMKSLQQANHDINKRRSDDYLMPLRMAVQLDDTGIAKVLLDHIYRNKTTPRHGNGTNNLETVKSLLHASLGVNKELHGYVFSIATKLADRAISEVRSNSLYFNESHLHAVIRTEMCFPFENNLTTLLQCNADVESVSHDNLTPLHLAAQLGDPQSAEILLDHGADTNSLCAWALGRLLISAVRAGKEALVKLLLRKGANININDKKIGTTLDAAVDSLHLFKLLLSNGADIDARDKNNKNILRRAVDRDDLSLIELIIEAHSDPKSPMGKTQSQILEDLRRCSFGLGCFYKKDCGILFHKVIQQGHIRTVEYLLNLGINFNVESGAENGSTPLHSAVMSGHIEIARLLIKNKADVNAETWEGATPLHYVFNYTPEYSANEANETPSRTRKQTEIIKILLDEGASVNAKQTDGTTVLGCAAKSGHTEAFKLLIENGADIITDGNINGDTLLHMAVEGGSSEIFEMVLNTFDYINYRNVLGETALHLAVTYGRIPMAGLLLDNDSDINIWGRCGTPLDYTNPNRYFSEDDFTCVGENYFDNCEKIAVILKQHIVKMIALDRYVSDQNVYDVNSFDNYERLHDECKGEIECMRQKKISASDASYYDILTKGVKRLALYARNKDIVDAMETEDHKHMFCQYSGMLQNRFKKGQKRAGLLEPMENSLSSLTGYALPDLVIAKLFDYLSNEDLKNLIKAGFDGELFKFLDGLRSAGSRDC